MKYTCPLFPFIYLCQTQPGTLTGLRKVLSLHGKRRKRQGRGGPPSTCLLQADQAPRQRGGRNTPRCPRLGTVTRLRREVWPGAADDGTPGHSDNLSSGSSSHPTPPQQLSRLLPAWKPPLNFRTCSPSWKQAPRRHTLGLPRCPPPPRGAPPTRSPRLSTAHTGKAGKGPTLPICLPGLGQEGVPRSIKNRQFKISTFSAAPRGRPLGHSVHRESGEPLGAHPPGKDEPAGRGPPERGPVFICIVLVPGTGTRAHRHPPSPGAQVFSLRRAAASGKAPVTRQQLPFSELRPPAGSGPFGLTEPWREPWEAQITVMSKRGQRHLPGFQKLVKEANGFRPDL